MGIDFLKSLVIIFGASAAVVFLLHKFKIPTLVGFLVAGVIIGPHGLGLIKDTHSIELLAEIGVVLLLFTIGIEFSMAKLLRMKKEVIGGGGLQVTLTIGLSALVAYFVMGHLNRAVFFGFLVALSSTAIVFKLLAEKGETDSPHGKTMVGMLIFQDLAVVPLMLLAPVLAGEGINTTDVLIRMGKAVMIIVVVLLGARWVIPTLLHHVVGTRSRELFIISIILVCIGIALLTSKFGLSLALGAFLAGLIISESEYAHQAVSDILPFKDSFIGLFFVSVGMLMDVGYISNHCLRVATAVTVIFSLKIVTGIAAALLIGSPLRTAIHSSLGLAQIGEFSFVLAVAGKASGIVTEEFYQIFLSASVVTMIITPFMLGFAPVVSDRVASAPFLQRIIRQKRVSDKEGVSRKRHDHVIIIGFGLNGRNLARVLKEADIPYVVLEMNSDTVREMKKKGEPIYFGDGTSAEILHKMSIDRARLLVVAISDPISTRRIVAIARHENSDIYIIVRTRYLVEVDDLITLGANEVIPEEFETSIKIFSRVLDRYNYPSNLIFDMVDRIRSGSYTALRNVEMPKKQLFEKCEWLPEMEIDGYKVTEHSFLVGKSITELHIRGKTGATVIAIRRGADVFSAPSPDFRFRAGDIILFTGSRESMGNALDYFKGKSR